MVADNNETYNKAGVYFKLTVTTMVGYATNALKGNFIGTTAGGFVGANDDNGNLTISNGLYKQ